MDHILEGVRVVELADYRGEYAGLQLAGLGAEVIKVEPPGGSVTRKFGPFYEDVVDPERSLHFWNYNRGKKSIALDLELDEDRERFRSLLATADVFIDTTHRDYLEALGLAREELLSSYPRLIIDRITDFGDEGPWSSFLASDLVHLALGGQIMYCGYSPRYDRTYDLPPMAPQAWHSYHIAGDQMTLMTVAALFNRNETGAGQILSCAIHEAASINTEIDVCSWVYRHVKLWRQTSDHAVENLSETSPIVHTKDGRWFIVRLNRGNEKLRAFCERYGVTSELTDSAPDGGKVSHSRSMSLKEMELVQRLMGKFCWEEAPWREAQDAGLMFAPIRRPEENIEDEHWRVRKTFNEVEHPEIGRSLTYVTNRWVASETTWKAGHRAPLLNEDGPAILAELGERKPAPTPKVPAVPSKRLSPRGKPWALDGVRLFDFSWRLATAGGTRFLASMGAEVIKVEWATHPDSRMGGMSPIGGREARRNATGPLPAETDPDMGGNFNNKNAGKRGLSLNVVHPEGMAIARRLIEMSDVVAEGFSPGVLRRWGLGYEELRKIKQDIIYVQQSGFGEHGTYGRFRALGPIAEGMSGVTEMSGLPLPAPPAGWGYSYLDWGGAYGFALAVLSGLYFRQQTGRGVWIDSSQTETGIFMSGVPILDYVANGRHWERVGNHSKYVEAAPHAAYRCQGDDRWIAIACFSEEHWRALLKVANQKEWESDERFASLGARIHNQEALDAAVNSWTSLHDRYELMYALQQAGVPAGVCQDGEDKVENDPQLDALEWLVELKGEKIGTWPVPEVPVKMSATPTYPGGLHDRGGPIYGQDNEYVLGELLGFDSKKIAKLAEDGVV